MPDHQPLAAAGDAAGRLVWQMVQVGAPPVLAGLLVTALLAEAWAGEASATANPALWSSRGRQCRYQTLRGSRPVEASTATTS
jgi:hypothetical protein